MSQGPETRFIASVHRLLHPNIYRMKNHNSYIGGPADMWYSSTRADLWVEYKYVRKLPMFIDLMNTKNKYALSALQQKWLHNRHKENRNVAVVLGCEQGGIIFIQRDWEAKQHVDDLQVETRHEIAQWISNTIKGSYEAPPKRGKRLERCV